MESNIDKYTYKEVKLLLEKKIVTPDELDWNKISVDDLIKLMRDGLLKEQDIPIFCRNHSAGKNPKQNFQKKTPQTVGMNQGVPGNPGQCRPGNQTGNGGNPRFSRPVKAKNQQSGECKQKTKEDEEVLISTYEVDLVGLKGFFISPYMLFNYKDSESWLSVWVNLFYQGLTLFLSYKFAEYLEYTSLGIYFLIGLFHISNIAMAARRLNDFGAPKALSALCVYWGIIPLIVLGCLPERYYVSKKKISTYYCYGNGLIGVIHRALKEKINVFIALQLYWNWKSTLLDFIVFPLFIVGLILQFTLGFIFSMGLLFIGAAFLSSRFMLGYWSWETLKEIFATIWSIIVNLTI